MNTSGEKNNSAQLAANRIVPDPLLNPIPHDPNTTDLTRCSTQKPMTHFIACQARYIFPNR